MTRRPVGVRRRSARAGFTLVEVLVALTILAVTLVPLFRVYSSGLRLSDAGERRAKALIVAEGILSEAAVAFPYTAIDRSGETEDGYAWQLKVEPYQPDEALPPLYMFQANVAWRAGPHDRSLRLETLRLEPVDQDR